MGDRRESSLFGAVDLREIVRILRRRSRIIAVTSITVVVLAIIFVSVVGPVYTATSTVLIDPRRTNVIDTNNQAVSSSFGSDDAVTESQALLIQSVSLLQLVVERLKLADDAEFAPPPGIVDTVKGLFTSTELGTGRAPRRRGQSEGGRTPSETAEGGAPAHDLPHRYQCELARTDKGRRHRERGRRSVFSGAGPLQVRCDQGGGRLAQSADRDAQGACSSHRQGGRGFPRRQQPHRVSGGDGQRPADQRPQQQAHRSPGSDGRGLRQIRSGFAHRHQRRRSRVGRRGVVFRHDRAPARPVCRADQERR